MLPVLMYHGVHAGPDDDGFYDPVYSVAPDAFRQQLAWLAQNGYRVLRLRDLGAQVPARSVVISFDDGDISNRSVALPALAQHDMVGEFFVSTGFVGRRGSLAVEDLRALVAAGMSVQSHGCTHRYLEDLSPAALQYELARSRQLIEEWTGEAVDAIALPGGRGGAREQQAAVQAGYRHVLNSVPGINAQWQPGGYLQRLAITRALSLADFARLVQWRGLQPRLLRARYGTLARAKQLLGNGRYERWRARWVLR